MSLALLPILLLATPSVLTPLHTYTALSGRPTWLDSLIYCLGMQTPLAPSSLNEGEYPAVAAMTTGYVFRVENQATVMYLQRIGQTGHLTTLDVSPVVAGAKRARNGPGWYTIMYLPLIVPAHALLVRAQLASDRFFLMSTLLLLLSRLLSVASLRARTLPSWHGEPEPGVKGDLLVLLSEDRWVRMKGLVDDLKAVTSGKWFSRLLVYIAVVILANATDRGKIALVLCTFIAHGVLAVHNGLGKELVMNGRVVKVSDAVGSVKKYPRRLVMARELVEETGRSDFAIRLGMINPDDAHLQTHDPDNADAKTLAEAVVTM
ncbi:hypothetical protein LTR10_019151 [Elasticomyces elasticus]|uniref:Uncharacterized protein n=1 Tax=Exophiala sideris TaxID=1016849 RepID=A0ABR0J898_9EURO|nr:hypothetical protein LTR10_019151 [Elasticomyces elasticus]KAK5025471.1 hypothetical protein LTR13_010435 [Exophiala sideris]KAK5029743.1 hypothetical protein LTS07_005467 [Exophiala sideris]KAK5058495.1 hypothetical protein LTR69_006900 [Exophiala sideris]KAK5178532.1 hypothetical protein LTR44_008903 [Eurotiomycetes sp. CCFEE 6388]